MARGAQLLYYEDFHGDGDEDFFERFEFSSDSNPLELLQDGRFRQRWCKPSSGCRNASGILMGMHYEQDMNLREIGEVMGVSESRVCQLHSQAVGRLRASMKGF